MFWATFIAASWQKKLVSFNIELILRGMKSRLWREGAVRPLFNSFYVLGFFGLPDSHSRKNWWWWRAVVEVNSSPRGCTHHSKSKGTKSKQKKKPPLTTSSPWMEWDCNAQECCVCVRGYKGFLPPFETHFTTMLCWHGIHKSCN